ncbi:hypothetical protein KSC_028530 [Ktedonobacter sp. SOSP1-52]|nr:hypothetical protein KSC_028530 [Ktedonobacter sp. SOSP1-52]
MTNKCGGCVRTKNRTLSEVPLECDRLISTETFGGGVPDELPVLPVCNDERTKQENHTWLPDIPLPKVPPYLQ